MALSSVWLEDKQVILRKCVLRIGINSDCHHKTDGLHMTDVGLSSTLHIRPLNKKPHAL